MPPKIILAREAGPGSAKFSDRVLLFATEDLARENHSKDDLDLVPEDLAREDDLVPEQLGMVVTRSDLVPEQLGMVVTRSSTEKSSNTDNAVFDCQVIACTEITH